MEDHGLVTMDPVNVETIVAWPFGTTVFTIDYWSL